MHTLLMTNQQRTAIRQQRRDLHIQSLMSKCLSNVEQFDFDVVCGLVFRDLHRANAMRDRKAA